MSASRFRERLEPHKGQLPEEAARVIEEELAKLGSLEAASSEFSVTRNYLDWLTSLPWAITSTERLDLPHAQQACTCPPAPPVYPANPCKALRPGILALAVSSWLRSFRASPPWSL